jgi:DNA helicase-2/ATP-dependent DNA helicase PcrA
VSWLDELNPVQREAVEHFEGPLLVLAGAGSGKTRVLTYRIAYLIEHYGVDPARILAVTFTNKAAGEMRARVRALLGGEPAGLWMGTFHALGARLLRRYATRVGASPNFTILDADDAERVVKRVMEPLRLPRRFRPEAVARAISEAKNRLVGPDAFAEIALDPFHRAVAEVYPRYVAACAESNAFDFDDLLVKPVELLERHRDVLRALQERFRFVLVDEYQDTNHAQYRWLELLCRAHGNLCVVGDDDQSIYGWRGADLRNILDFERAFPNARVLRLEQNYRSTQTILAVANAVIAENVRRKGKRLFTENPPGEPVRLVRAWDEEDEAAWVVEEIARRIAEEGRAHRDFAVLYRTNAQSRALEEALRRAGMPYRVYGGIRFYERREIRDVLAYLRLLANPKDAAAFLRVVNTPRRGIGDASLTALASWAAAQGVPLLEAARRAHEIPDLAPAAAAALVGFAALVERYAALATQMSVRELLRHLIDELGWLDRLREEGVEGEERAANVEELIAGAAEFGQRGTAETDAGEGARTELERYLQQIALITDVDRMDPDADAVTLMTLHNAKGLEFPVVFVTGLEEGLFPLSRAYDTPEALEEERRLFYVGITRAREVLVLTHARARRRGGEVLLAAPSSFLRSVPASAVVEEETERARARPRGARRWWAEEPGAGASAPGTEDAGSRGWRYEWAPEAVEVPELAEGERVRHPRFGLGTVRALDGWGPDLKATVEFDEVGPKRVVVRYANLEKVVGEPADGDRT